MVHFIHFVKEGVHTVLAYPVREIGRNWVFSGFIVSFNTTWHFTFLFYSKLDILQQEVIIIVLYLK